MSILEHTPPYVNMGDHTSSWVSMSQHTSTHVIHTDTYTDNLKTHSLVHHLHLKLSQTLSYREPSLPSRSFTTLYNTYTIFRLFKDYYILTTDQESTLFGYSFLSTTTNTYDITILKNIVVMENYFPISVVGGRGGVSIVVYDKMLLDLKSGDKMKVEVTSFLETLEDKDRSECILGLTGKKLDGEGSVSSLIVKTDTYHDQVKEG